MKNSKCPTWFVVKWLTKHPTHTAKAPETEGAASSDYAFVSKDRKGTPVVVGAARVRSDWTIYNERGRKVRFKQKRKTRVVGNPCDGERLFVVDDLHISFGLHKFRSPHQYDVLIRKRGNPPDWGEYDPRGIPISTIPTIPNTWGGNSR